MSKDGGWGKGGEGGGYKSINGRPLFNIIIFISVIWGGGGYYIMRCKKLSRPLSAGEEVNEVMSDDESTCDITSVSDEQFLTGK